MKEMIENWQLAFKELNYRYHFYLDVNKIRYIYVLELSSIYFASMTIFSFLSNNIICIIKLLSDKYILLLIFEFVQMKI